MAILFESPTRSPFPQMTSSYQRSMELLPLQSPFLTPIPTLDFYRDASSLFPLFPPAPSPSPTILSSPSSSVFHPLLPKTTLLPPYPPHHRRALAPARLRRHQRLHRRLEVRARRVLAPRPRRRPEQQLEGRPARVGVGTFRRRGHARREQGAVRRVARRDLGAAGVGARAGRLAEVGGYGRCGEGRG
ncbi:hypothetical protein VTK56DRAFT_6171 [Thermocarpiscus australiensis]